MLKNCTTHTLWCAMSVLFWYKRTLLPQVSSWTLLWNSHLNSLSLPFLVPLLGWAEAVYFFLVNCLCDLLNPLLEAAIVHMTNWLNLKSHPLYNTLSFKYLHHWNTHTHIHTPHNNTHTLTMYTHTHTLTMYTHTHTLTHTTTYRYRYQVNGKARLSYVLMCTSIKLTPLLAVFPFEVCALLTEIPAGLLWIVGLSPCFEPAPALPLEAAARWCEGSEAQGCIHYYIWYILVGNYTTHHQC